MAEKICKCCEIKKDESEFYKKGKSRLGSQVREAQCKKCHIIYKKILSSKPKNRYLIIKRNAKRREHDFKLSFDEFLSFKDKPCRYCGKDVFPIKLDRIDNEIGYVIGNVDSCCTSCNLLKHVNDEEEFLSQVSAIYEFQKSKIGLKNEQKNTS